MMSACLYTEGDDVYSSPTDPTYGAKTKPKKRKQGKQKNTSGVRRAALS